MPTTVTGAAVSIRLHRGGTGHLGGRSHFSLHARDASVRIQNVEQTLVNGLGARRAIADGYAFAQKSGRRLNVGPLPAHEFNFTLTHSLVGLRPSVSSVGSHA
jgi:hypothetical protein